MKKISLIRLILIFLGFFSLTLLFPLFIAVIYKEYAMIFPFALPVCCSLVISVPVYLSTNGKKVNLQISDGFLLVTLAWVIGSLIGALPYYLSGYVPYYSNAVFESVSGFTTTGATIIPDVEILPHSLHFWRGMTHWIGGMGIIVLSVALFPILGTGGFQLLKGETTGPMKDKFTPKVKDTAKILWLIYCGLTLLQFILLMLGGMNWFDSIIHSFSTLGTGGFSTRNSSIAYYNSPYIEWVCSIFMFIAGFNFTLTFRLFQGKIGEITKNSEARAYFLITAVSVLIVTVSLSENLYSIGKSLRYAFFHVTSIMTTTGFMADNHNNWPSLAQLVIFGLMFIGGCSGSTAGGAKVIRYVILCKQMINESKKALYPKGVFSIHLDQKIGRKDVVYSVSGFIFLYFTFFIIGVLLLSCSGIDLFNSINASIILLGNIGLGLGKLISGEIFFNLPEYLKWFFSLFMIIGRLEIYTVLILFSPFYWK